MLRNHRRDTAGLSNISQKGSTASVGGPHLPPPSSLEVHEGFQDRKHRRSRTREGLSGHATQAPRDPQPERSTELGMRRSPPGFPAAPCPQLSRQCRCLRLTLRGHALLHCTISVTLQSPAQGIWPRCGIRQAFAPHTAGPQWSRVPVTSSGGLLSLHSRCAPLSTPFLSAPPPHQPRLILQISREISFRNPSFGWVPPSLLSHCTVFSL